VLSIKRARQSCQLLAIVGTMDELPRVLTVEEAAQVLRIGRTAAYEAVRRGEVPSIRVGRRLLVPRHRLEALVGPLSEHDLDHRGDGRA
jgi:excisionase family DNA binding protein